MLPFINWKAFKSGKLYASDYYLAKRVQGHSNTIFQQCAHWSPWLHVLQLGCVEWIINLLSVTYIIFDNWRYYLCYFCQIPRITRGLCCFFWVLGQDGKKQDTFYSLSPIYLFNIWLLIGCSLGRLFFRFFMSCLRFLGWYVYSKNSETTTTSRKRKSAPASQLNWLQLNSLLSTSRQVNFSTRFGVCVCVWGGGDGRWGEVATLEFGKGLAENYTAEKSEGDERTSDYEFPFDDR